MNAARFINLAEWWHWSYGERYWAFQTGQGTTLPAMSNAGDGYLSHGRGPSRE